VKNKLIPAVLILMIQIVPVFPAGKGDPRPEHAEPLTIIVPFAEKGGTDAVARILAPSLEKQLGRKVQVVNRVGGSGAIGMIAGAASVPDGNTMTMITREVVSLSAMGLAQITRSDFRLLGLVNQEPAVLVVASDSPFLTLDDLIGEARDKRGKIRFASAAKPHFYILEFEDREDILFNKIPYNGAAQALPAVMEGQAEFTLANPGELMPYLKAGKIRALGIMDDKRCTGLPDVPTFSELGLPIQSYTWRGLAVPAGTSGEICDELESVVEKACLDPEFLGKMEKAAYTLKYMNALDFSAFIARDEEAIRTILSRMRAFE